MRLALLSLALLALAGCATTGKNPEDPWEAYNRKVFAFNDALDRGVVKPVTKGYQAVTPDIVEQGVSNFFANIDDVGNSMNNLLQGQVKASASDILRVVINSTVGFAGLVDVATHAGLTKHDEDFGQTLGVWSFESGPYVVLPLIGPSTVRDGFGFAVDYATDPVFHIEDESIRYPLSTLDVINTRADLLKAEAVIGNDFFDRYSTIRNAFLQYRKRLVHNGKMPVDESAEDDLIKQLEAM